MLCILDFAVDPEKAPARPHPSSYPPPARRVKPIKAMNSSLSMLLHFFPFAAAVLRPSKLVHFRTSSMMLSLMNISQASFGEIAVEPGTCPGQLLRMLWLLVLP